MDKVHVKVKKLCSDAKLPLYATEHSAGCDFYSVESVLLKPGDTKKISVGLSMEIPIGFYLRIEDRSGLAIKGVHHVAGIIDADYRGEIFIVLHNSSQEEYQVEKHDRIAQGIVAPVSQSEFGESDVLSQTQRGSGGFHSTGKK